MTTTNTTTMPATTNTNAVFTAISNRFRDITTTDKVTGETSTAYRGVNLRTKDFTDSTEWKAYSRRLLELSPVMQSAAVAFDSSKEEAFTAARKQAVEHLQGIVNLLSRAAGFEKFTIQKKDVNYIIRLAYGRKIDREHKAGTIVTVKSKFALQTLVEDVLFYHINGLKLPSVTMTTATETALAKLSGEEPEKKAEGKTAA